MTNEPDTGHLKIGYNPNWQRL